MTTLRFSGDVVRTFGDRVFAKCSLLQNLIFPSKLTTLGESTFEDCTSLQSVTFPRDLVLCGPGTFQGVLTITSLTMNRDLWPSLAPSLNKNNQNTEQLVSVYGTLSKFVVDRSGNGPPTLRIVVAWYQSATFIGSVVGAVLLSVLVIFIVVKIKNKNKNTNKNKDDTKKLI
jgi:hypothetical protein